MAVHRRNYIALENLALTTTGKNLQIAYNATKTGEEKLTSDPQTDTTLDATNASGTATFGEIVFYHTVEVLGKAGGINSINDWIVFPVTSATTRSVMRGGQNVFLKATGATTIDLTAGVLSQGEETFVQNLPY